MVARSVFINGIGLVDLLSGKSAGPVAPVGIEAINSDLESYTISDPIVREQMWDFTGATVTQGGGSYSNFLWTSVVQTDGPGGATSKVLNQHFPYNGGTNYAASPTGTGITLTSAILKGGPVTEASIEYDFRCKPTVAGSGTPFGWGFKLPGLAGARSGFSVPSGGQPSPNGFSARLMGRRNGTEAEAKLTANLVGYFYAPNLPAGAIGNDLQTGKLLTSSKWSHLRQYHRMNTVLVEGDPNPPADGIHEIWVDGVLAYRSTTTVYRFYTEAMINRLCWDNFYGGSDVADGKPWGPRVDADHQFDNLVVTTY